MKPRPTIRAAGPLYSATLIASLVALFYGVCGILRYRTYTNQTFDLAFYTRMTWGMLHLDFWEPILDAHLLGLRIPFVFVPAGIVGLGIGIPVALYLSQALAVAFAAHRLAAIGERRFGAWGAWAGALALVLHPNVGHVVAYEVHPGTVALAPLALLADAIDRRDGRTLLVGTIGVLLCREDLAIVAILAAAMLAFSTPGERRFAFGALGTALLYLLVFVLVLHPLFKPAHGSLEAHFGPWGRSPGEIVQSLLMEPRRVLAHLGEPERLSYLPRIVAPLALLPFFSARAFLLASPILAINLLSHFPTTTRIDSHYLTTALPFLVLGAFDGIARLEARRPGAAKVGSVLLLLASLAGTIVAGLFSPFGALPAFVRPTVSPHALDLLVAAIPPGVSVQAPDPILPHVAERRVIHRAEPFRHDDDAIVLDLGHRLRFAHSEDLLRTTEEPYARAMLSRTDRRIAAVAMPYVLLLRTTEDSARLVDRVRIPTRREPPTRLGSCLAATRIVRTHGKIAIDLVAREACPNDLAIRLGPEARPARVDLLFEGLVSPSHLRAGDHVRSLHEDPAPAARTLHIGLLRSSGARPAPEDPVSVELPVE